MSGSLHLSPHDARTVTLVAAIEEADAHGELVSETERTEATRSARQRLGEDPGAAQVERAVVERATELLRRAAGRAPFLERLGRELPLSLFLIFVPLVPLLYGLGRSALGPEKTIDIFANPLVVLIVWNGVVSVLGLAALLLRRSRRHSAPIEEDSPPRVRSNWLTSRLGEWLLLFGLSRRALRGGEHAALSGWVLSTFANRWRRIAASRYAASAQVLLHSIAALLLISAVGEAYARGLFTEYTAKWESTWLDESAAQSLAQVLFEFPSAPFWGPIELPPAGSAAVDAGPWIHRFAIAALVYGLLPRLVLLALTVRRRRRTDPLEVPISATLARRLRARVATRFARVTVLPYSCSLPDGGADRLRDLLVEVLGDRAVIEIAEPLAYGADEPISDGGSPRESEGDLCRVVLFGLAQPPESEVHREFLDAIARGGAPTIAIVDASGYRRRFGDDAEGRARLAERRRAWDRVLGGDDATPAAHLDLSGGFDDASYARLSAAVSAARKEGSAR